MLRCCCTLLLRQCRLTQRAAWQISPLPPITGVPLSQSFVDSQATLVVRLTNVNVTCKLQTSRPTARPLPIPAANTTTNVVVLSADELLDSLAGAQ